MDKLNNEPLLYLNHFLIRNMTFHQFFRHFLSFNEHFMKLGQADLMFFFNYSGFKAT